MAKEEDFIENLKDINCLQIISYWLNWLVRDFITGKTFIFSFVFQMVLDAKDNKSATDLCLFCHFNSLIPEKKCLFIEIGFVCRLRNKRIHFC